MSYRRRRKVAIGVILLTAAITGGVVYYFVRPPAGGPISAAFTEPQPAWPPAATTDLETELARTEAVQRLAETGELPDGAEPDAGPEWAGLERTGLRVRTGDWEGIFFLEVVFGDADFEDTLPMAMLIHGRGDRARLPGGPFNGLSSPIRVIVPQAPDPLGDGFQWLPVRLGQGLVDQLTTSLMMRAGQLARMLHDLTELRPTVGKPMVVGFSQGGMLTFTMALHFSDIVSNAFPLSSWLPPALLPPYKRRDIEYPRIRSVHGGADRIIALDPTVELFGGLRERGFDAEIISFEGVGHEMSEAMNEQLHVWLEEALGHEVALGIEAGILDGGVPEWPEGGWPEGGWPEGGMPPPRPRDGGMPPTPAVVEAEAELDEEPTTAAPEPEADGDDSPEEPPEEAPSAPATAAPD